VRRRALDYPVGAFSRVSVTLPPASRAVRVRQVGHLNAHVLRLHRPPSDRPYVRPSVHPSLPSQGRGWHQCQLPCRIPLAAAACHVAPAARVTSYPHAAAPAHQTGQARMAGFDPGGPPPHLRPLCRHGLVLALLAVMTGCVACGCAVVCTLRRGNESTPCTF